MIFKESKKWIIEVAYESLSHFILIVCESFSTLIIAASLDVDNQSIG